MSVFLGIDTSNYTTSLSLYDTASNRVEMEKRGPLVITRVINYGYVIPQEEQEKLFRKFYRVEHSRSQDTGGTGLGLAIVEQIAQLHGGSVSVRSDLEGTVFEVTLPEKQKMEETI